MANMKTVGIVGLGLIGGSIARDYKETGEWRVLAYNRNSVIEELAKITNVIDDKLDDSNIGECDLLFIALYPGLTIKYLKDHAKYLSEKSSVIDCCGIKREVCEECFKIADEYGFRFIGGHPMAGRHYSGFKYSKTGLFKNASMVIVPKNNNNIEELAEIKQLLEPMHFGRITLTTAENHDRVIAFTSQMAHIVSNAYIKSPTAKDKKGFSAGSYKDMTRVAWLNEDMWTELFMDNKDNLIKELDYLINALSEYRDAMSSDDADKLKELLADGKQCKEMIDGH